MIDAIDDEDLFLSAVFWDAAKDVPNVLPELLTQPWRAVMLSAIRDHRGDTIRILEACRKALPENPWIDYLERIQGIKLIVTESDVERIAEGLMDRKRRYALMEVYAKAAEACRSGNQGAFEIRASVSREQGKIDCGTGRSKIIHVSDVVRETIQDIKDRMDGTKAVLSSGLPSLDAALGGGFEPGSMIVVGARPKMGKTGFAGLISQTNAKRGIPVFGCELEMSEAQQGRRIIARTGGPTLERIRTPKLQEDMERIFGAYNVVKDLPWHFTFTCRTFDEVETSFREWRMLHTNPDEPAVGVLDYLQLAEDDSANGKGRNREREVANMARRCKLLAKELAMPIIVLCQLNRGVEQRDPPRPMPSDLRESGAIEQDADAILMLYRPSVYDRPGPDGKPDDQAVEILIPAQREGASGESVWARFIGERATFEERKQ